jgi:hypothetical protein
MNLRALCRDVKVECPWFKCSSHILPFGLSVFIKDNHCVVSSHLAVFVIEREGLARLDFIQNMEYKFVELLSVGILAFLPSQSDNLS